MDVRKKKIPAWLGGKKLLLLCVAAAGVVLLITGGIFGGGEVEREEYTDVGFYTQYLEGRICEIIEKIDGVDEAVVFLTLDCSSEYVYRDDGASDFLILSGGDGEEAVQLCHELQLDFVELNMNLPQYQAASFPLQRLKEAAERFGIFFTFQFGYF